MEHSNKSFKKRLITMLVVLVMIFAMIPTANAATTANNVTVVVYDVSQSGSNYTTDILYQNTFNVSAGSYTTTTNNDMGLDANLTTSSACVFDAWYKVADALSYTSSNCTTNVTSGKVYVDKFANLDTSTYSLSNSGWMFVVNDEIPVDSNGNGYDAAHAELSDGDVVSIFYVTDYTKTKYLYFDETGATTSGQKIQADGTDDETLYLSLMEYSLNMSDKYVQAKSGASGSISTVGASSTIAEVGSTGVYTAAVTDTAVTGIKTADGQTTSATAQLIPAYYPINATVTTTLSAAKTNLNTVLTDYSDEESASSDYTTASWNAFDAAYDDAQTVYNDANATISGVLSAMNRLNQLGAALIGANDARLNRLGVTDGYYYTPGFSPDVSAYTYDNGMAASETYQLGFINDAASVSVSINNGATATYDSGTKKITVYGMSSGSGNYTVTITVTCGSGSKNYYLTIPFPSGGYPTKVLGYLVAPSQYATGVTYGSISSDNNNTLNPTPPAYVKTLGSGGLVSPGSLGGYIVYEFSSPITDNANNNYGTDFIVYGNAFTNWCEPGIVQVAGRVSDGQGGYEPGTWYTIAGSEYYSDTCEEVDSIKWRMSGTTVQYSLDGGTNWTNFRTSAGGWWPKHAAKPTGENYGATSQQSLFTDYVTDFDDDSLEFSDLVKLDDNVFYQFGYCDVHPNGSNYGTMTSNPYTASASTSCGDGIDLAWAVDENGETVDVGNVYYVRVYTGVLENAGAFGEVSTEVTSVLKTTPGQSAVGMTSADITLNIAGDDYDLETDYVGHQITGPETVELTDLGVSSITVTVTDCTAEYINNTATTSTTISGIPTTGYKYVRVIAQNSDDEPFLVVLKLQK